MENQPLLKGQRGSAADLREESSLRHRGGSGGDGVGSSLSQAYSRAAVFAVFFFPALGGLLFG